MAKARKSAVAGPMALGLLFSAGCKDEDGRATSPDAAVPAAQPPLISEAGRLAIWTAENRANLLRAHGLDRLSEAIAARDMGALQGHFAPPIRSAVPSGADRRDIDERGLTVTRSRSGTGGDAIQTLNRGQLVRWLDGLLDQLPEGNQRVRPHIITLRPADPAQPDGAWAGTGKLEVFATAESGARGEFIAHFEISFEKLDEGRLEKPGWITEFSVTEFALGTSAAPLLREAAAERGIHTDFFWDNWKVPRERRITNTGGVYLTDYNRDGLHDLFVTDLRGSLFYVGEPGGKFREVTRNIEIRGDLGGGFAAFADLDGDGWEDLIHGIAQHPDGYRVYQNLQGKFFKDVTAKCNLPEFLLGMSLDEFKASSKQTLLEKVQVKPTGVAIADYDLDGKLDLYVTRGAGGSFKSGSWIDGKAGKLANNQLLRNLGDWQFADVTNGAPLDGGQRSTSNAVWIHADDDLRPDLYVIDEFGDGILLANGADGQFTGIELNDRPTDFGSMGMTAGDIDNDGHTDIYVAEMYSKAGERVMANIPPDTYPPDVTRKLERLVDGSQLYLGGADRKFRPTGRAMGVHAVGWAWGASLADLNNDGWLDLYATAGFISHERGKPDG